MGAPQKATPDRVAFYKDNRDEWRWSRTSTINGEIVGASTEGYKNRDDCVSNFRRSLTHDYVIV